MAEFTHNDAPYRLVPTTEWDFRDSLFAKQASGGMSVAEIERGVMVADPDAVIAMMAVSIHRVRKSATAAKLREEIEAGGMRVLAFFEQLEQTEVGDVAGVINGPPDGAADAATQSPTTTSPVLSGVQHS